MSTVLDIIINKSNSHTTETHLFDRCEKSIVLNTYILYYLYTDARPYLACIVE